MAVALSPGVNAPVEFETPKLTRVMLEPFDLPGMVVAHQGDGKELVVIDRTNSKRFAEFLVVKGLNGENGSISLNAKEGCFVYGVVSSKSHLNVKLSCKFNPLDAAFKVAASFVWNKGLKEYDPISFVAKGLRRSYILAPLLGLKDESYNVYFNITQ